MKVGTQVTYTQKGYASDFIVEINNKSVTVPQRKAIKEEEYSQRKGIVTNIEKVKCGLVNYTVKWKDVGGYWEDDESVVYREDIQEIEKEEEVEEKAPITTNQPTQRGNHEHQYKQDNRPNIIPTNTIHPKGNNHDKRHRPPHH